MVILQLFEQPPLVQSIFAGELEEVQELVAGKQDLNCLDSEKRSALHAAAFKGDVQIMEVLLENGARVNAKDSKWITPLHRACSMNAEDAVGLLLRYNADVTARDRLWQTPLHIAAANDAYQCVELLLNAGPNPNVTDRSGRTALHHAAHNGHTYIADLLLSKGCIVNACDKRDSRPLHCAAQMGHVDTVDLLLRCGADVNASDWNQYTPLHVAAASGNDSICRLLLNAGAHVDSQNSYGNTPLHIACLNGQLLVCQDLVSSGANFESVNFRGQTPVHIAAASTHGVDCMSFLLSQHVNINKQSLDGRTPLHMTAIHGRFTRSKSLIDKGAIIDCLDKNGCTPLHIAAQYGHELLANTLMSYGANPSYKGYEGRTPLHVCCLSGSVECCRKFLQAGVNLNALDNGGKTPIHCAAYQGSVECLDLLVSNGANFLTTDNIGRLCIHYAASQGHYQCVFTLVGIGSPTNAQDAQGCTPLHLAAGYDLEGKCVEYLLQHDADPLTCDKRGFTPLHYAIAGGNVSAVNFLLGSVTYGDFYDTNAQGVTPLHLAAKLGNDEILQAILKRCVNVNVRDESGLTPLMLAGREGHKVCVMSLLGAGAKVNMVDEPGKMTVIHYSCKNGHASCLLLMMQSCEGKLGINSIDRLQRTPLMLAVSGNHLECVQILLNYGADPNVVDADRHSSLFRAVVTGQNGVVQLLLANNASANSADIHGKKVIHLAAACGHIMCFQTLLTHLSTEEAQALDNQQCSALHWACYNGHANCVELLLKQTVFNTLEGNKFSPVHCATFVGSEKCLELLINHFGSQIVHLKDCRSRTPLHIAALHGHTDCAKFLLDKSAEVNALDEDGRTPFIASAQFGQSQAIELLLNYKVDKSYQDKYGNTALHWACLKKHSHTALLLLEDLKENTNMVSITNKENKTPLHLAARNGLVDVTRELLNKGASVVAVDSDGCTPALCCAPNSHVAQCLALILLNLPSLASLNITENDPLSLISFLQNVTKSPPTKNRQSQTVISLMHDPDAFEIKRMFGVRFPHPSSPPSIIPNSGAPNGLFLSPRRNPIKTGNDCFIIEQHDDSDDDDKHDLFAKSPNAGGLDLHKSYSDMSITTQEELRGMNTGNLDGMIKAHNLKELCYRKKECHECMLLQHRCSDCTLRYVLRQHLQGKTSPKEFNEFLMKTLNDTSSEYRQKLLQAIDAISKDFGAGVPNNKAVVDLRRAFRMEKTSKQVARNNKNNVTFHSPDKQFVVAAAHHTKPDPREQLNHAKKESMAKVKMWNDLHNNRNANGGRVNVIGLVDPPLIDTNEYRPVRDRVPRSQENIKDVYETPSSPGTSGIKPKVKASRSVEYLKMCRNEGTLEEKLNNAIIDSRKLNMDTFVAQEISKNEPVFHSDFLKKLKQIKMECIRQREEEYFQAISSYVGNLLKKCNFDSCNVDGSTNEDYLFKNLRAADLNVENPKRLKDRLNENDKQQDQSKPVVNVPRDVNVIVTEAVVETSIPETRENAGDNIMMVDLVEKPVVAMGSGDATIVVEALPKIELSDVQGSEALIEKIEEKEHIEKVEGNNSTNEEELNVENLASCLKITPINFANEPIDAKGVSNLNQKSYRDNPPQGADPNVITVPIICEKVFNVENKPVSSKNKIKTKRELPCVIC